MSKFYGLNRKIVVKTADYQILESDIGTIFTNRGAAGAVIFTLPYTSTIQQGWWCEFRSAVTDQNFTVASYASSDDIVTHNDATADSVELSTLNEISGGTFVFTWDGTGWCCQTMVMETQTVTVA